MSKKIAVAASVDMKMVRNFSLLTLLTLGIYLILLSSFAFATGSTTFAGVAEVICDVTALLIFDVGRGIATLSIIALGVAAMYGKATWAQAVTLAMGIGIIFGALSLAPLLVFSISNISMASFGCVGVLGAQALGVAQNLLGGR
jgi:type IV secretory pathway VirB2 component (pilin)